MLYLNDIVSYVPPGRKSVTELASALNITQQSATLYQKVYGLNEIALAEDQTLADMLDRVLEQIVPESAAERRSIKYVFHCHAAPCVCPSGAQLLDGLKAKHGLDHAIAVGVAQDQCATPLTALNIADILLESDEDDAKVLLLTGELNFDMRLRIIPNTAIIGDAAAACLVGKTGKKNKVVAAAQRKFEHASVQPAVGHIPVPATSYGDDLIQVVKDVLSEASLQLDDISLILIHNVNTISWKFFARNYPCPADIIYMKNVAKTGHCFTSDPFINYCDAVAEGRVKAGDYFLMVSVGTSSTFAATVVQH